MLKIGNVELEQTKGEYLVEFEPEWADDKSVNQTGDVIGTLLGERVYITIVTNQLTKEQAVNIRNEIRWKESINITFDTAKKGANAKLTKAFNLEARDSYKYLDQQRGIYQQKTLTFKSVSILKVNDY